MSRFGGEGARRAVAEIMLVYAVSGFALASWGSRLPAFQRSADLSGEEVGWIVAALAAGTLSALLFCGKAVALLRPARAVRVGALLCVVALVMVAVRPAPLVFVVAAVILGVGNALYDIAMNVQGSALARRRRLMPVFHGAWSIGALLGSLGGALAALLDVSLGTHLVLVAFLITVGAGVGSRHFDREFDHDPEPAPGGRRPTFRSVWADRRTVSLGLLALGAAFAEGSANDWLTLGLVDHHGYGYSHGLAAAGLGVFVTGMIVGRFGSQLIPSRIQPDRLLLVSAFLVVMGTALVLVGGFVVAHSSAVGAGALAAVGLLTWGLGAALGVPLAMDAAALPRSRRLASTVPDTGPEHSAAERVAVVSTIGYAAFLAGPPLLGWLAEAQGFLWTLVAAPVVMALALGLAAVCHPLSLAMRANVVAHGDGSGRSQLLMERTSVERPPMERQP